MTIRRRLVTSLLTSLLAGCVCMAGCAGGGPKPISTGASVTAAEDVNPNSQGRSSPVMVRIFRLSAEEAFRSAGIVNLQGEEPAMVAGDLTGPVISQLVRPGQSLVLDVSYAPETAFIGVVAEFIDPGAEWRAIVPVPEQGLLSKVRRPDLTISLSGRAVAASFE